MCRCAQVHGISARADTTMPAYAATAYDSPVDGNPPVNGTSSRHGTATAVIWIALKRKMS